MQGLQTHTVTLETVEPFEQHEYPDQGAPMLKYREAKHNIDPTICFILIVQIYEQRHDIPCISIN